VHTFEVVRSEQLTPHLIRVVLGGKGFDTFIPTSSPTPTSRSCSSTTARRRRVAATADPGELQDLPAEQQPTVRTYTVRRVDTERRQIVIDFVVHGEHGVAGRGPPRPHQVNPHT